MSETCDQCGFDSDEWNDQDTVQTLGCAHRLVASWTEQLDDRLYNKRPSSQVWSVGEYVNHVREVMFGLRALTEVALEGLGTDLGAPIEPGPPGARVDHDPEESASALATEALTFARRLGELDDQAWGEWAIIGDNRRDVRWASRHAVHDLWHHLIDIADVRVALGDAPTRQVGELVQINRSGGGVPKLPIDSAVVGHRGVDGDSQAARVHHGRPWQALCLWSADVIEALVDEGHPIFPGAAGENLTLRGIDWSAIRAGLVVEVGEVVCRISAPADPCAQNARWFADGDFGRMDHIDHPGWSRWYASVEGPGAIQTGDHVVVA